MTLAAFLSEKAVSACDGMTALFSGIANAVVSKISQTPNPEIKAPIIVCVLLGIFSAVLIMGVVSVVTEKIIERKA